MSRWWFLGHFVPILHFWVGYRSFACPGGYAFHKKLGGAGIFLAIVYWILTIFITSLIVALIALFLGSIGSHEQQQQIQDAVSNLSDMIRAIAEPKP